MEQCDYHVKLCEDIAFIKATIDSLDKKINGSMDAIRAHIEQGWQWRGLIISTIIGLIVQLVSFSYLYGMASRQIEINTKRLDRIEEHHGTSGKGLSTKLSHMSYMPDGTLFYMAGCLTDRPMPEM